MRSDKNVEIKKPESNPRNSSSSMIGAKPNSDKGADMPSVDPLAKIKGDLKRAKRRRQHLLQTLDPHDPVTKGLVAAVDRQIATHEQRIRAREYASSPKKKQ